MPWGHLALLAGAVLALALLARLLLPEGLVGGSSEAAGEALGRAGPWAYPLYVALFVVLTLTFLPTSPLSVAGGFLFGPLVGVACAWTGAMVGGAGAYGLGRSGRRPVRDALLARMPPVARLLERHPLGAVLASRLLLMPFGPASYGLGLAGVRPRDFLVGTGLGILPLVTAFALSGAGFRDVDAFLTPAFLAPLLGAVAVTVAGARLATRAARRPPAPEAQALSPERGIGAPTHEEPHPGRP